MRHSAHGFEILPAQVRWQKTHTHLSLRKRFAAALYVFLMWRRAPRVLTAVQTALRPLRIHSVVSGCMHMYHERRVTVVGDCAVFGSIA